MGDSSTPPAVRPGVHLRNRGETEPLPPELARHPALDVVALLTKTTPDEWVDRWRTEVGPSPDGHTILAIDEGIRSAATTPTTSSTPIFGGISLKTASAPVRAEVVADTLEIALAQPAPERQLFVWVESLTPLFDGGSAVPFLRTLRELGESRPVTAICHADVERLDDAVVDFFDTADIDESVAERLDRLRAENPTNFGYLRRHWRDTRRAIEASTRSYPQARQLHGALTDTETTPQSLGVALQALVELGVIELWNDTVGSNRYDLTTYDAELLDAIGESLAAAEQAE
ncbi:hypothetical protein [Haloprofundus salilacus]|uniref:hypothetical protein n=1 Tax=Haloprofundus salilacus TaxID=2876190 RepID=UPI001CCB99EF|nr:hypothetical protein [Haloprofundus salilacus]